MLHVLRLMIAMLLWAQPAAAGELGRNVQQAMKQAEAYAVQMKLPPKSPEDTAMQAARQTAAIFESPELQEKLRCERQRLKDEVFTDYSRTEKETSPQARLAENEKLYLFISSSIPEETIHAYLDAMDGLKEPAIQVLMKGFVPGERGHYLLRISQKDRRCVDQLRQENPVTCERFSVPVGIQPSLFARFTITQVPALVYERAGETWKITGDAGLASLLERINREAKSPGLDNLVSSLTRMNHE